MNGIALTISMLALVAVVGLWIGGIKIRGVGFGIGGVLFGGIIVGIQVGPGFFSSLRVSGLRLNLFAILIVVIGALVTALIYKLLTCRCPWCWGYSPARSPTPGAAALSYATVYPLVMFLRIITPQLLAVIFWM
jgi:putative transport protein